VKIVMAYIPFVMWVCILVLFIGIVWIQTFMVPQIENKPLYCAANIACPLMFFLVNKYLAKIPMDMFLGEIKPSLAILWTLGYAAMASTMQDWLFPGMPTDFWGVLSFVGMVGINIMLSAAEFVHEHEPIAVIEACLHNVCDVISGFAFGCIFTYNAFGPNQEHIYMIDNLDRQQKMDALYMIVVNFVVNIVKLAVMLRYLPSKFDDESLERVQTFALVGLRKWYWLVIWLLVSTSCACGACMVLQHDGMDISFKYKEWYGTWPFVSSSTN